MTTSPAGSLMGAGSGMLMDDSLFLSTTEFSGLGGGLGGFDTNMFAPDSGIDFERDFGSWFNGSGDDLSGLEMK